MKNNKFLAQLKSDFPAISFKAGKNFIWSPEKHLIIYEPKQLSQPKGVWALIHEVSHYSLGHRKYGTDFTLLKMETEAWSEAKKISQKYEITIDDDHIEECLDTYRDWLHKRATCPSCRVVTTQKADLTYGCFNCQTNWQVPRSPLCQIRKQIISQPLNI